MVSTSKKMPPTQQEDEAGKNKKVHLVLVDKQEAVGGEGGWAFDSGCNLSGLLRRVHVYVGPYRHYFSDYPCLIKRIFLEFHDPNNSNSTTTSSSLEPVPDEHSRRDRDNGKDNLHCVFDVGDNDAIETIDVWTNNYLVIGVQFRMKSGAVSQLFGSSAHKAESYSSWKTVTSPNTFRPRDPSWKLVGIHGMYGDVVDRLGFTFAKAVSVSTTTNDEEVTVVDTSERSLGTTDDMSSAGQSFGFADGS